MLSELENERSIVYQAMKHMLGLALLLALVAVGLRWLAGFDVTDRWAKEYKGEWY